MNEGSNSNKMSLEDKLVERIKTTELFALVGDEDALRKLTERAITEALFQPTRVKTGMYSTEERDSPLVAATREAAEKAANHVMSHIIDELCKNPEFVKKCVDTVSAHLPMAVLHNLSNSVQMTYQGAAQRSIESLQKVIQMNGGSLPPVPPYGQNIGIIPIPQVREGL